MSWIKRTIEDRLVDEMRPNKVALLVGPRRVGKTELIKTVMKRLKGPILYLNGEDQNTVDLLQERSQRNFERILGEVRILVIDEAHAIPDIGMKLKLMVDTIKDIKVLATGSSVFDLNNQLGEPLVGRKTTFILYPLSQLEFSAQEQVTDTYNKLEERLIYGAYPELEHLQSNQQKARYLLELVDSYLLKDILAHEGIKKREKIVSLLRLLAFRVGSEISIEGIGNELQISKNTVDTYLDVLCKTFVIHRLGGFSRNGENEITKKGKYYFFDNGIRNALIRNFNPLTLRDDTGKLWENYLVGERIKKQEYQADVKHNYFWRTHTRQEIDWIEEGNDQINAFEIKWNTEKFKIPSQWQRNYPDSDCELITKKNYLDFVT